MKVPTRPRRIPLAALAVSVLVCSTASAQEGLVKLLKEELDYSFAKLVTPDKHKPYFLAFTITDTRTVAISATLGSVQSDDDYRRRVLDVDVRVGDHKIDNTHKIRGEWDFSFRSATRVSIEDDPRAIKHAIWLATDRAFKDAVKKYKRVKTNLKTKVEEEQRADDFSKEKPVTAIEKEKTLDVDRVAWRGVLKRVASIARDHPRIFASDVSLSCTVRNRYMVTSEGSRLQHGQKLLRVSVSARTKADDGMDLDQAVTFNAATEAKLPEEAEIRKAFRGVIAQVLLLRDAPLVEPYTGPAILRNRASGVFFHEIFGHRIEGHRQKDVEEGQTFARKVGQAVLPTFIDVYDDPTRAHFRAIDLRGFYRFDDEAVPAARVDLVQKGILKTFLLSRSTLENFPVSNGHGRREPGNTVVARQANLFVESSNSVSFEQLRKRLVNECKQQKKPYGLLFEDISGGFTMTSRYGPQAFKVLPVVVYRVYPDGRPDQLVRGVDIVGTPLTCFSKIVCTGDDPDVFNGTCGAESGWVPVSAVSPSILVSQIEIEKRQRSQERVPILPSPLDEHRGRSNPGRRRDKK